MLDSRAMRQQIEVSISGESELSQGGTKPMTDIIVVQTFPQLSLSLVPVGTDLLPSKSVIQGKPKSFDKVGEIY